MQVVYLGGDPGVEKGVGEGKEPRQGVSSSRLPTWATRAPSGLRGENIEHAFELPVPLPRHSPLPEGCCRGIIPATSGLPGLAMKDGPLAES